MIRIEELNKQNLRAYVHSDAFVSLKNLPISKHRAESQINNPKADKEDILLLLALKDEELVGYLGILPGSIYHKGRAEKFGWMSCLWVDPAHRGHHIAMDLVLYCLKIWDNKIIATDFTDPAKKLYDKSGKFDDLPDRLGIRLYNRLDLCSTLPKKVNMLKHFKHILKFTDVCLNAILDLRFTLIRPSINDFHLEYAESLDEDSSLFIQNYAQNQLYRSNAEDLNWIIRHPWILSAPEDELSRKYHFSSVDKLFLFIPVKILNRENKLIGILLFARRNDTLKLPYCYYSCSPKTITNVIIHHLKLWNISTFTCYQPAIVSELNRMKTGSLFKKKVIKKNIFSTYYDIQSIQQTLSIQDGDGDSCFT